MAEDPLVFQCQIVVLHRRIDGKEIAQAIVHGIDLGNDQICQQGYKQKRRKHRQETVLETRFPCALAGGFFYFLKKFFFIEQFFLFFFCHRFLLYTSSVFLQMPGDQIVHDLTVGLYPAFFRERLQIGIVDLIGDLLER